MQYLTFKLHFKKNLIIHLVINFEMIDDLTYLAMKFFKENQQWIWKYSINISHFTCLSLLDFKNNLNIETTPHQNCCREKEWHKERREREREGVLKSCFLYPLLYKTPAPFFFPCSLTFQQIKSYINTHQQIMQ